MNKETLTDKIKNGETQEIIAILDRVVENLYDKNSTLHDMYESHIVTLLFAHNFVQQSKGKFVKIEKCFESLNLRNSMVKYLDEKCFLDFLLASDLTFA